MDVVQPRRKNSQGLGPYHCNQTLEVICYQHLCLPRCAVGQYGPLYVSGDLRIEIKTLLTAQNSRPLDSCQLKDPTIASIYKCSISNKFNTMADAARSHWKHFVEEVTQSVACTAGPIRRQSKKPWVSSDTLKIIDQRRSALPLWKLGQVTQTELRV